ncbi:MAG: hypothetical protein ACUVXD_05030 [Thermodesulfobacteriota bacterium]
METENARRLKGSIVALVLLGLMVGTASAATYNLCAGQGTLAMPDGVVVPIWGLGLDPGGGAPCPVTVPGPQLAIPAIDDTLTVNLRNTLAEPVSLHILGQRMTIGLGPVFTTDPSGLRRVMSFTRETSPGGTGTYTWGPPFRPGTYVLQSGTNPAKQVQMGLFAAVKKDSGAGEAYPGVSYDKELVIVFHDVDPAIHAAVDAGTYGPGGTITSSIYRQPSYFLINGMAWPDVGLDPVNAATPIDVGERVLLRFVNAGLETHSPLLQGAYMTVIAEDGNKYNYSRERYGFELSPAKTVDAIFQPAKAGAKFPLYDAALNLTNAGAATPGGMLAYLQVAGTTDTHGPVASALALVPNPTAGAPSVTFTATADDTTTGGADISGARFWVKGGTPSPMAAQDGAFNSPTEGLTAVIDISALALGNHTFYIQARDALNNWGPVASAVLNVTPPDTVGPTTSAVAAAPNPTAGAASVTLTANSSDADTGNSNIASAEYWIGADPGQGAGTAMIASDGAFDSAAEGLTATVDVSGLATGNHTIYVRARDSANNWGAPASVLLQVTPADSLGPVTSMVSAAPNPTGGAANITLTAQASDLARGGSNIAAAEYWVDGPAPAPGSGTPMNPSDGAFDSPAEGLTATVPVAGLSLGIHSLSVRAKDAANNWGAPSSVALTVQAADSVTIYRITYRTRDGRLRIYARSNQSPAAALTAYNGDTGALIGPLSYRARYRDYYGRFFVRPKPNSVRVNSSLGGTDTKPVPYP